MSKDITRCPCCGNSAVIETIQVRKGWEADIHCNGCLLALHTITYDTEQEAIDSAIRDWNHRIEPTNAPLTLADLIKRIKQPVYVDEYYLDEDGLMTRTSEWDVIDSVTIGVCGDAQNEVEMKSGEVWPIGDPRVKFYEYKPKEIKNGN